jgi:hypothetical protein
LCAAALTLLSHSFTLAIETDSRSPRVASRATRRTHVWTDEQCRRAHACVRASLLCRRWAALSWTRGEADREADARCSVDAMPLVASLPSLVPDDVARCGSWRLSTTCCSMQPSSARHHPWSLMTWQVCECSSSQSATDVTPSGKHAHKLGASCGRRYGPDLT